MWIEAFLLKKNDTVIKVARDAVNDVSITILTVRVSMYLIESLYFILQHLHILTCLSH